MIHLTRFSVDLVPSLHGAALALAVGASVTDLRARRIPNLLTVPALLLALGLHFAAGGFAEAAKSMVALLVCGFVFLLFYLAGGMGAGDVKLIAAEGALLGLGNVTALLTFTAIAGGMLALVVAGRRGQVRQTIANTSMLMSHHASAGLSPHPDLNVRNPHALRIPYALAIAAGTVLTLMCAQGSPW